MGLSKEQALAILKAHLMAEDERIIDVIDKPRAPSHVATALAAEAEGGLYITAVMKDPRVPGQSGYAGLSLSQELWQDLGDDSPGLRVLDGQPIESPAAFVKAYALMIILEAFEQSIEALLERGSGHVESPSWVSGWPNNGDQHD